MNTQSEKPPMATIWKYPMSVTDTTVHEIPKGAKALHFGPDPEGTPCVWFLVDPTQPKELRAIVMVGTGHTVPIDAGKYYVDSFVAGPFVNHVFAPPVAEEGSNVGH
jgi:hypothetical protein